MSFIKIKIPIFFIQNLSEVLKSQFKYTKHIFDLPFCTTAKVVYRKFWKISDTFYYTFPVVNFMFPSTSHKEFLNSIFLYKFSIYHKYYRPRRQLIEGLIKYRWIK